MLAVGLPCPARPDPALTMPRIFKPKDDGDSRGAATASSAASALDLVAVERLHGSLMVMKDGRIITIMKTGAVNFDLKSEYEQVILLNSFAEMLSALSVDFPLQVFLHSARLDTSAYVERYTARMNTPGLPEKMRTLINGHLHHFEENARQNYLLDRSFYVVIPYLRRGVAGAPADGGFVSEMPLGGLAQKFLDRKDGDGGGSRVTVRELEQARAELDDRANQISTGLSRLGGIRCEPLGHIQIVGLLRELYNPGISERQRMRSTDDLGDILTVRMRRPDGRERPGQRQLGPGDGGPA